LRKVPRRAERGGVLDFTAALYLGLRHPSSSLASWASLTTGMPAALATPLDAMGVAAAAGSLLGCAQATLASSTLHLFWDLFALLAGEDASVHIDAGAYPIGRWGAERLCARGVPTQTFHHHDPLALSRQLAQCARRRRRPLVLADGYCPGCGPAPISAYSRLARRFGGRLVIDDTQAVGVLGAGPGPDAPFGRGGGGSLRWHGLEGAHVVVCASLAKGLGVPLAVLAGDADVVARFERSSETRVHCSQPSAAALRAAERALALNRTVGDALRDRLVGMVDRFRTRSALAGLPLRGGMFPVQSLAPGPAAARVHRVLLALGVRTVLHRPAHGGGPVISFVLTARHREREIDAAVAALVRATRACAATPAALPA
jgi:8-amino-7-oxononanoate synthase